MSVLIIAEPTTGAVKPATLTTVGAAAKLEGDLHVLVIGADFGLVGNLFKVIPEVIETLGK